MATASAPETKLLAANDTSRDTIATGSPKAVRSAEARLLLLTASSTPMGAAMFNVLPLFALRIGASVAVLGVLYAVLWVTDVMQYLASARAKRGSKRRWLATWYLAAAVSFTAIFALPLLPQGAGPTVAIVILILIVLLY